MRVILRNIFVFLGHPYDSLIDDKSKKYSKNGIEINLPNAVCVPMLTERIKGLILIQNENNGGWDVYGDDDYKFDISISKFHFSKFHDNIFVYLISAQKRSKNHGVMTIDRVDYKFVIPKDVLKDIILYLGIINYQSNSLPYLWNIS